jgi:hypothetical protein
MRYADDAPAFASDAPDSLAAGVPFTRAVDCQGNGMLFSEVALASAISFFDFELVADSAQCF